MNTDVKKEAWLINKYEKMAREIQIKQWGDTVSHFRLQNIFI